MSATVTDNGDGTTTTTTTVLFEDRNEWLHNLYLYWTPTPQWAVRAEFAYDRYNSAQGIATDFANLPKEVETVSAPLG